MDTDLEPVPITSQKHDPAWKHCQMFKNGDKMQLKCVYCGKMFKGGGIHRIKEHLAGHKGNASTCLCVPPDVRLQMQQSLDGVVVRKRKKQKIAEQITNLNPVSSELVAYGDGQVDVNNSVEFIRVANALEPSSSLLVDQEHGVSDRRGEKRKRSGSKGFLANSNVTVAVNGYNDILEGAKRVSDHVHMAVGRFLYDIGAPLEAVNSVYFQDMVDAIALEGSKVVLPSYHDIRGSILKNAVEEAKTEIAKQTASWARFGCSILVDHTTTRTGRSLVLIHVESREGVVFLKSADASGMTDSDDVLYELLKGVVEEIGASNVLQVITNLEEQCVVAGKKLSSTFPTLYWTPCAACAIDVILEDFSKLDWINTVIEQARFITRFVYNHVMVLNMLRRYTNGNDIVRTESTRAVTDFATLKRMVDVKHTLQSMVTSQEWMDCPCSKYEEGLEMLDLISNLKFWSSCDLIVRLTEPLLRLLRIITLKKEPAMGNVHAGMYRVKEAIKREFSNRDDYMVFWRIIEHRWEKEQNLPLHSASFYLNPKFFYSIEEEMQNQIQSGLFDCIEKLVPDIKVQDKIIKEISSYKNASGDFGRKLAIRARDVVPPVEWWSTYGGNCQNLARLAIRILSQTCNCVGYRENQVPFNETRGTTNHLERQRLNDLVLVQYNLRLKEMFRKTEERNSDDPISVDRITVAEEWIKAKEFSQGDYSNSDWTTLHQPASITRLTGHGYDEVEELFGEFNDYEIFRTLKEGDEEVETS